MSLPISQPKRTAVRRGLLLLIMLTAVTVEAAAQGGVLVGAGAGYEFGVPLAIKRDDGLLNGHSGFEGEGTSYEHTGFLGASVFDPTLFGSRGGILGNMGVFVSSGHFRSETFLDTTQTDPTSGRTYQPRRRLELSSLVAEARLDLAWRYQLGGLAFTIGPWAGYRIASSILGNDVVIDSNGGPAQSRTISEERLEASPLRGGFLLGASVGFPIGAFTGQWSVTSRGDAGALQAGLGLRSFTIGTGIALYLSPQPPEAPAAPAPPPRLAATVDLYSDDGEHVAVVRAKDIHHRNHLPFVPVLFFDHDSSSIPLRYPLLRREETDRFSLDSLAGLDAVDVYHRTLDLLGLRLREKGSTRITLLGSASDDEPISVAHERAETIKRYLTGIWGIDASRIEILADRGDRSFDESPEMRRSVHIVSAPPEITSPIVVEWLERELEAPSIGIDQQIDAAAGLKGWTATITQGDHLVGRYASGDRKRMEGLSLSFLLNGDDSETVLPLVAELVVTDSTGRMVTAHDTLPIAWKHDSLGTNDPPGDEHFTFLFLYPGVGSVAAAIQASRDVSEAIRSGATVTAVVPAASAERESAERQWGNAIAGRLLVDLQERGVAIDHLVVESDTRPAGTLPESLLLRRGMRIVVEQSRSRKTGQRP